MEAETAFTSITILTCRLWKIARNEAKILKVAEKLEVVYYTC